jgi:hypothetical protein
VLKTKKSLMLQMTSRHPKKTFSEMVYFSHVFPQAPSHVPITRLLWSFAMELAERCARHKLTLGCVLADRAETPKLLAPFAQVLHVSLELASSFRTLDALVVLQVGLASPDQEPLLGFLGKERLHPLLTAVLAALRPPLAQLNGVRGRVVADQRVGHFRGPVLRRATKEALAAKNKSARLPRARIVLGDVLLAHLEETLS